MSVPIFLMTDLARCILDLLKDHVRDGCGMQWIRESEIASTSELALLTAP